MNMFYTNLDNRISLFNVYNVLTMADDFMVVSGMPPGGCRDLRV